MKDTRPLTACFFGDYDPEHNRTKLLIRGLELQGVRVIECHVGHREKDRYSSLLKKYHALKEPFDVVVLGHSSDMLLPLIARAITFGKVLFWDIQFSYYDNLVFDRKLIRAGSIKAGAYWLADWINCRIVDRLILDTKEHFRYFEKEFGVAERKLVKVASSADTDVFFPRPKTVSDDVFRVEYHGKYIPVQGVDVVVRAAKLLEAEKDITFTLIGDGQDYKRVHALSEELGVNNMTFLPFIPLTELPPHIANADLCVGLIGDVPRVARTVANKLYEAAAMGRVAVNADVPAIRELFTDGEDVVLIPQGDAEALATKIRYLRDNRSDVKRLGDAAYETFKRNCSPEGVGLQLLEGIQAALK